MQSFTSFTAQGDLSDKLNMILGPPETDFLVVSDRKDRYLSDAFGPMKNIVPSRNYNRLEVSATV